LQQAATWVAFGLTPVAEEHLRHLKRPDPSGDEEALNGLVLALRQARLSSVGIPALEGDDGQIVHRCSKDCPPTWVQISPDAWTYKQCDLRNN
jgi:hypothetical protein